MLEGPHPSISWILIHLDSCRTKTWKSVQKLDELRLLHGANTVMKNESEVANGGEHAAEDLSIPLCDPHFHMWDVVERPNPNLGDATEKLPAYRAENYLVDMKQLPFPLQWVSGVHVETVVGQSEGSEIPDTVEETKWVCSQLDSTAPQHPFGVVAFINLSRETDSCKQTLERHIEASGSRLRGVRMILNHHPHNSDLTWPNVDGGHLQSPNLRRSLALLERRHLSFDLSCNPHQIGDAVKVLSDFPDLHVVINHLGFLHDGENEAHTRLWRQGMESLAALPNTFVKLSMPWFARDGFHRDRAMGAVVGQIVRELIAVFGCNRCMFASNYPVDKMKGITIPALYRRFLEWSSDLSDADRAALFHDTAVRAYGPLH